MKKKIEAVKVQSHEQMRLYFFGIYATRKGWNLNLDDAADWDAFFEGPWKMATEAASFALKRTLEDRKSSEV